MEDNLAIINSIIKQHQTIRDHVKLVGDSLSDDEAMVSLTRARSDWIPGRMEMLSEKSNRLQQTLSSLDEGLKNHFSFEEQAMPSILGDLFMRALVLDHQEIKKEIEKAKSTVADTKLEGLGREELLSREAQIQQAINSICQLVEDHATREEVVLEMVKKALEKGE